MYARKRLDIGWIDLASGLLGCAFAFDRDTRARRIEQRFSDRAGALCCLSVRSGLDLFLDAVALPAGSEVLVSALTIPDMWRILEDKGLVPVPVDVDPLTMAPRPESVRRASSARTRALLIAHLFGTRIDLDPWVDLARASGWLLLEDCAQSFTGLERSSHPGSDLAMFSFGPIKTATALAGAVLRVRDPAVLERMRALQAKLPVSSRSAFAQRVLKYAGLKLISAPAAYRAFVVSCAWAGKSHDELVRGMTRGFPGPDFFVKIRHRPCAPLLALLDRRLARLDPERIARRAALGRWLAEHLPRGIATPGIRAPEHTFWVFPVLVDDPRAVVDELFRAGFDATATGSLGTVPVPASRAAGAAGRRDLEPRDAQDLLERAVYLPVYAELPESALERLASVLRRAVDEDAFDVAEIMPLASGERGVATPLARRWSSAFARLRAR